MELREKDILDKTHYGLNIYSHVLRQYYTDEVVIHLSGKQCKLAKNPFKKNTDTLNVYNQDWVFVYEDVNDPEFKGNPFSFASLHYKLTGNKLLEKINEDLHLRIGKQRDFYSNNSTAFIPDEEIPKEPITVPVFLAGKISTAVRNYATINTPPDRLIIHFYKSMSEVEVLHIERALEAMDLPIPVFIVSINKTESNDITAFDNDWNDLMPISGTYVNIGKSKYLLFNNTRYPDGSFSKADGFPFPIKLSIDCTEKEQLSDTKVIKELIEQVYQFSRMYWKSVRQQNLPVTIKYPEMVAQIAPHFDGDDIPAYGKENLWFL